MQDFVALFCSIRRDGRSLGQMARDELGLVGGAAALVGVLAIMIILIAVLGLVVVNAMRHSPWATSTVAATIPIAIMIGLFMRHIRPGRVLEGTAIGVVLLLLAVFGGSWVDASPTLRGWFDYDGPALALMVILYGFAAAVLPVWLLLAPRDYLIDVHEDRHDRRARDRDRDLEPRGQDARRSPSSSTARARCSAARCFRSCSSRSPAARSRDFTR